jgi:alkylation response protein AidB-like acyl-CoA dehydrogenase
MAKLVATDTAMQVTSDADRAARDSADFSSGAHLLRLGRFFRDAKATQLYEGTNQIQRLVIARHVLQPSAVSHQPSA